VARSSGEGRGHGSRDVLASQQVAGADDVRPMGRGVHAQRPLAREAGRPPLRVDDRELPVGDVGCRAADHLEGLHGRGAERHEVERSRSEGGIGHVLGGDRTDAGPGEGAAGGDREGHGVAASGITAMASISTSHSGRARPETTSPVETGNTPFSHLPTVR
jgi:hypothetical protein